MKNSNDKLASFYNKLLNTFKNTEVTEQELNLIKSKNKKRGKILDIGCGTGRHIKNLANDYIVTGIDESIGMLKQIQNLANVKLINDDIFNHDFKEEKYDLIILFWNSLNEIALNENDLNKLFTIFKKILNQHGSILINIDNVDNIDLNNLDFEYSIDDDLNYHWKAIKKDENNLIKSKETFITNEKEYESIITQKWWTLNEIKSCALKHNFTIEVDKIKSNDELYLTLKYNGK